MRLRIKTPEDIAAEAQAHARDARRAEAQAYLSETDWLVVRQAETGIAVPEDIRKSRVAARNVLSGSIRNIA